ncbi:MAG: hypothetical protein IPK19_00550 [Chloroflexi bacterium]|nr:hypothetical protein [Chloroflexota bacterium]
MKQRLWLAILALTLLAAGTGPAAEAQEACTSGFSDTRDFVAEVYARSTAKIDDGVIAWESDDWVNIVRRLVGASEFLLNHCAIAGQPLAEQQELRDVLAEASLLPAPIESIDLGLDSPLPLRSDFTPSTALVDLNGDGTDELLLHTQVPYFSDATVYQIRGGLSIAFFMTAEGWQGQVIAPVTEFVTDQTPERLTYAMTENHLLSVAEPHQALGYAPEPEVTVLDVEGGPLTFVTQVRSTGAGEAKELAVLSWEDRFPAVELRVAFDDWCSPGATLNWEIREDGSVFVPSNGGEEGSPLHCGRTTEVLFQWQDGEYVPVG